MINARLILPESHKKFMWPSTFEAVPAVGHVIRGSQDAEVRVVRVVHTINGIELHCEAGRELHG